MKCMIIPSESFNKQDCSQLGMFYSFMGDGIGCNVWICLTVTKEHGWVLILNLKVITVLDEPCEIILTVARDI